MTGEEEEFGFDEELDEEIDSKTPPASPAVVSKTPASGGGGQDISVFFMSTIGPGEKKQKLLVNTGNPVSAIKQTVGNMFGLDPSEFHLSHGGVTLDEGNPLSNYNVKDGDTLLLIPASTAGI
ncbi:MAG: hypothetical protein Kow0069_36780 [Promethearchaeota archaeon]